MRTGRLDAHHMPDTPRKPPRKRVANPLSDLVDQTMRDKRLTGREVAARGGFSHSYLGLIRNGHFDRPPRQKILTKIARGLDIPLKRVEDAAFATQRVTRTTVKPTRLQILIDEAQDELSAGDLDEIGDTVEALIAIKRKSRH